MFCPDLTPHGGHLLTLKPERIYCPGRKSHGIEAWGDIIDEADSRQDEAESDCDKFDRTHAEESETF